MIELTDRSLLSFLQRFPSAQVEELFACPWTVLCVFRSLEPLLQNTILRFLCVNTPLSTNQLLCFVKKPNRKEFKRKIEVLLQLKIFTVHNDNYLINKVFAKQCKEQIFHAAEIIPWREAGKKVKLEILDPNELENLAREKWDNLLYFIVGATGTQERIPPSQHIINLLLEMEIVQKQKEGYSVTNKGYNFLLLPLFSQLWYFIRCYILQLTKHDGPLVAQEALKFCFRLALCLPGHPYAASLLSMEQKVILSDFFQLGLIYKDQTSDFFYPTFTATNLLYAAFNAIPGSSPTSKEKPVAVGDTLNFVYQPPILSKTLKGPGDESKVANTEDQSLKIVTETNYKCYVYTTSSLHLSMLKLFLDVEVVLPNLVVGVITRKSVKQAFRKNIEAKTIINFLISNAHPLCKTNKLRAVPDNVTDQIILWEMERNRLQEKRGVLYEQFKDAEEFEKVVQFTLNEQIHVWSNQETQKLFVLEEHHDKMKGFFQSIS